MTIAEGQLEKTAGQRLVGKVALVTGGSRGIGAAIAMQLAGEGATVAISYAKNQEAAEVVVGKIAKAGGKAVAFKADASSIDDGQKLVEEVVKFGGRIDILVNNAGVYETASIEKVDLEHYSKIFDVNVKGVVVTTIAALKKIPDGGRIINISSTVSKATLPGASIYSATKSALDTLTRVWAQDLGPRKITVNAVAPGGTLTDMFTAATNKQFEQSIATKTALGRIGLPEDISSVVAFLASDDARWITGQVIGVDGGLVI